MVSRTRPHSYKNLNARFQCVGRETTPEWVWAAPEFPAPAAISTVGRQHDECPRAVRATAAFCG